MVRFSIVAGFQSDADLGKLVRSLRSISASAKAETHVYQSRLWRGVFISLDGHVCYVPGQTQAMSQCLEAVCRLSDQGQRGGALDLPRMFRRVLRQEPTRSEQASIYPATPYESAATGGCFDQIHAGHVAFLQTCQGLTSSLTVYLNTDRSVRALKGSGRPLVSLGSRSDAVRSLLRPKDRVAVFTATNGPAILSKSSHDVFMKGSDYWLASIPEARRASPPLPVIIVDSILEMHTSDLNAQRSTKVIDRHEV